MKFIATYEIKTELKRNGFCSVFVDAGKVYEKFVIIVDEQTFVFVSEKFSVQHYRNIFALLGILNSQAICKFHQWKQDVFFNVYA